MKSSKENSLAIDIFKNEYSKSYLHQLVSSLLDMDRMDYLNRIVFILEWELLDWNVLSMMLNIVNDKIVVESKGIYSVEKFLIARRLMYWQVYFHKTVVCAEQMLIKICKEQKLRQNKIPLFSTSALQLFLDNNYTLDDFNQSNY